MRVAQLLDNTGVGTGERHGIEAANAGLLLAHYRIMGTTPGVAIGTTPTKVTLTNNVSYLVNGNFLTKTATADLWTLSGATVAAGSIQRYALTLDGSGNPFAYEAVQKIGTDATQLRWTNIAGTGLYRALNYFCSQGQTLIGSVQVITNATTTFTPGTTALNAAGLTVAFTSGLDSTLIPLVGDGSGRTVGAY